METQNLNKEVNTEIKVTKVLKCKPGLGKLNRAIKKAINMIETAGHKPRNFKRNYENGTANYSCPCGFTVKVDVTSKEPIYTVENSFDVCPSRAIGEYDQPIWTTQKENN